MRTIRYDNINSFLQSVENNKSSTLLLILTFSFIVFIYYLIFIAQISKSHGICSDILNFACKNCRAYIKLFENKLDSSLIQIVYFKLLELRHNSLEKKFN